MLFLFLASNKGHTISVLLLSSGSLFIKCLSVSKSTAMSEESWSGSLCIPQHQCTSQTVLQPNEFWIITDQPYSNVTCIITWHSDACKTASYNICSSLPLNQIGVVHLVFQINPTLALVVIQHRNGFPYFFASNCNCPGVMTVTCWNQSHNFLSLQLREWGPNAEQSFSSVPFLFK